MTSKIVSGLMLCGLLAACGDGGSTTPGAPGTAVTSAGSLHVLKRPLVMTYEIDSRGRLRPPVTQSVAGDLVVLAGEPQGRVVYGAHGGWTLDENRKGAGSDGTVVTYAPDPRDGTLTEVSHATVRQVPAAPCSYCNPAGGAWTWLKAGANRVHGLWCDRWGTVGRHSTYSYVSIAVAGEGQLGPVSQEEFASDSDPGEVLVDARSDVLYKAGRQPYTDADARGGLEAHAIGPDGTLTRMGWTNLCLSSTMCEFCVPSPLVTARGFLFASVPTRVQQTTTVQTVCSYQGLALKALDALDLMASAAEAFVPSSEAEPALLAMNVTISAAGLTRQELRVFSMKGDGGLQPLASDELPSRITQILFHPSGRFFYVVDTASRLRAYTIDSNGRLELTASIDGAGTSMAITLKGPQAADH